MRKRGLAGDNALNKESKLQAHKTPSMKQNSEIQHFLDIAVEKHTKGHLEEAVEIYRHILQVEPDHPAVLQLFHEVISSYEKALIISPNDAVIHCNLGVAHQELGKLERRNICRKFFLWRRKPVFRLLRVIMFVMSTMASMRPTKYEFASMMVGYWTIQGVRGATPSSSTCGATKR